MCGICGYIGSQNFDEKDIKILMLYNMDRGRDSTGYYTSAENIVKDDRNAMEFLVNYKNIKKDNIFIGHCRRSSMGNINKHNAHPFEFDNIVGVHNGHVKNWYDMESNKEIIKHHEIQTDSAMLIYMLSKYKDPRTLYQADGGIAIIFTDKREKILYAFRNSERPLFTGTINDCTYLSSTKESLMAINCNKIKELEENTIYKYTLDGKEEKFKIKISKKDTKSIDANTFFVDGEYIVNTNLIGANDEWKNKEIARKGDKINAWKDKNGDIIFVSPIVNSQFKVDKKFLSPINFPIKNEEIIKDIETCNSEITDLSLHSISTVNNDDSNEVNLSESIDKIVNELKLDSKDLITGETFKDIYKQILIDIHEMVNENEYPLDIETIEFLEQFKENIINRVSMNVELFMESTQIQRKL